MDRFEEMQYQIATEGIGANIAIGIIALLTAASIGGKIKKKIDEKCINQYEIERHDGTVTAKTMNKAMKVKMYNMPYPEYVERRDAANKAIDDVYRIMQNSVESANSAIDEYLKTSQGQISLKNAIHCLKLDKKDIINSMIFYKNARYILICVYDIDALIEEVKSKKNYTADVDKALRTIMSNIYKICERHIHDACSKINQIPEMKLRADPTFKKEPILFDNDESGTEVSCRSFSVTFGN